MPNGRDVEATAESVLLTLDIPSGDGTIRVLTLNRVGKRNAINTELALELKSALSGADQSDDVRAVVLAGAGDHFCSGGDLTEFRNVQDPRSSMIGRARLLADIYEMLPCMSVPVIAAVQGAALGAGAALAIGADMTIGAEDISFGYPEILDAVVPALVMMHPARQFSQKLAFEMMTTGLRLDASGVQRHNLVNQVVGRGDLLRSAIAVAHAWAGVDPRALERTKRLFYRLAELSHRAATQTGLDVTAATWVAP